MATNILTIVDSLTEPPSEPWAFRNITMISHENMNMSVLVHTTQEMKDAYYKWLLRKGLMDFVDYLLSETEWEDGVRIDIINGIYPRCIVVKYIRLENQLNILGRIKFMSQ